MDSAGMAGVTRPPSEVLRERIEEVASRLADEARKRATWARKLRALAKPAILDDLTRLVKEAAKVQSALPRELRAACRADDLFAEMREYAADAEKRIRSRLGRELKIACEGAGLGFRVVSREEPVEIRIPPLLVSLDFRRGRANLLFAREVVVSARPESEAILKAHATACRRLERAFAPERFFDECLTAYRAALAARGRTFGERVEILDFLPYLAVEKQSKRFRASPARESFTPYGKARFAFDVLRLRKAGALARKGFRLNFGVTTGTTATQKDRVIYLEDEHGDGEYKLTVFFTSTGENDQDDYRADT